MSHQPSVMPSGPTEPDADRLRILLDNLNNLRSRLKSFAVIDQQGQAIGQVQDLILDASHQLNLVIAQPGAPDNGHSFLLDGRQIQKVSVQAQSVFVDIAQAEIGRLPVYPTYPSPEETSPSASEIEDLFADTPEQPELTIAETADVSAIAALDEMGDLPASASPATDAFNDADLNGLELEAAPSAIEEELSFAELTADQPPEDDLEEEFLFSGLVAHPSAEDLSNLDLGTLNATDQLTGADFGDDLALADLSLTDDSLTATPEFPETDAFSESLDNLDLPIDALDLSSEASTSDDLAGLDELELPVTEPPRDQDIGFSELLITHESPESSLDLNLAESNGWSNFGLASDDSVTEESLVDDFNFGASFSPEATTDQALEFTLEDSEAGLDLELSPSETSEPDLDLDLDQNDFDLNLEDTGGLADLELATADEIDAGFSLDESLLSGSEAAIDLNLDESTTLSSHDLGSDEPLSGFDFTEPTTAEPGFELALDESTDALDLGLESSAPELDLDLETPSAEPGFDFGLEESSDALDLGLESSAPELDLDLETPAAESELDFGLEESSDALDLGLESSAPELDLDLETPAAESELDFGLEESSDVLDLGLEPSAPELDLDLEAPVAEPGFDFGLEESSDALDLGLESSAPELDLDLESPAAEPGFDFGLEESSDALDLGLESSTPDLDLNLAAAGASDLIDLSVEPASTEPIAFSVDQTNSLASFEPESIAEVAEVDNLNALDLAFSEPSGTFPEELGGAVDNFSALDLAFSESSGTLSTEDLGDIAGGTAVAGVGLAATSSFDEVQPDPWGTEAESPVMPNDIDANGSSAVTMSPEVLISPDTIIPPDDVPPETVDEAIELLEERLKVDYKRRKIGDVIIRKQIETRMIQVPVRYEKLVIEQVSPEQKPLAEVDLTEGQPTNVELPDIMGQPTICGEFESPKAANYVLSAITKTLHHRCKKVRVEIELEDGTLQHSYQEWLDRCIDILQDS